MPLRPRVEPPAPAPEPAPALPPGLSDLVLLARAVMREWRDDAPAGSAVPGTTSAGQTVAPGSRSRGPLPKEQKKFYKLGNLPAAPPEAAPTPEAPDTAPPAPSRPVEDRTEPPVAPELPAAGERPPRPGRVFEPVAMGPSGTRRRSVPRRQRVVLITLAALSTVGSFLVGLFLGGSSPLAASAPAAAAKGQPAVGAVTPAPDMAARALVPDEKLRRALATIDEAEAAHGVGDWARMDTLLEQAEREAGTRGSLPGLAMHRAENALRRGDMVTANTLTQNALERGEDVARAYALRAVIAQRAQRPEVALPMLEAASRADPFESRYLFYQGQALRARGKLQEASVRLRRALDRVEDGALAESYGLVFRLTQTELGEEAAFAEELARRLAMPNPAPDWLVTAAARECQAGRLREGAELMRRAIAVTGPAYAAARLSDVFFRRFEDRPEFAPLFAQYLPPPPAPASAPAPARVPAPAPTPGTSLSNGPLSPTGELATPPLPGLPATPQPEGGSPTRP